MFARERSFLMPIETSWAPRNLLEVADLDDGDDLLELLADLLEHAVVADGDDGHAGYLRVVGPPNNEGVYVEPPGREHSNHVGQHAGLVLD